MITQRPKSIRARLAGASCLALALAAPALADERAFNVAAQDAAAALNEFASQADVTLVFSSDAVAGVRTNPVSGSFEPEEALTMLLADTGLALSDTGTGAIAVAPETEGPQSRTVLAQAETETSTGRTREKIIVTGQKREEYIQDVPIAISAFSMEDLNAQKIEGGFDLLKAIPNVSFSKTNFTSYNFSIRGVGTKAISATTDPGVAVAFNNTALIQNRLFEQEYFDIERVEVLRGPQGTLYGRNATSGVINVISAKPTFDEFYGQIKAEVGKYDTQRISVNLNIPIKEDVLGVRLAGALTDRDGYDYNAITKNRVNGRDLWSTRFTVGFEPDPRVRANFIWERFEEDDNRSRTGKQLCHRDPGPDIVGDTPTYEPGEFAPGSYFDIAAEVLRPALFSQGCMPGSLYTDDAFGTPNGLALPFVFGTLALGDVFPVGTASDGNPRHMVQVADPYGGAMQSRDLREIASFRDPVYRAGADILELNVDIDVTPSLTFSSQTAYVEDETYSFQDFNRFNTEPIFTDTSQLVSTRYADLAPGGVFCDPQLGCSDRLAGFDIAQADASQFSQEFRLQSSFAGPVNFSVGANYTNFETVVDYYVFYNLITAMALTPPFFQRPSDFDGDSTICPFSGFLLGVPPVPTDDPFSTCPYVDPNPVESINGEGHNYFRSKNPYELESWAGFGEVYWNVTDALKLTAGLRYTDDEKTFTPVPSQILLAPSALAGGVVSRGYPEMPPIVQEWQEWTGRFGFDWKPDLDMTDETLLYGFYAHGYKGGGANPPTPGYAQGPDLVEAGVLSQDFLDLFTAFGAFPVLSLNAVEYGPTFDPEFVDSYEIGAKNTLLGGAMTLNVTGFYYDYEDYQVSQIRDRTAVNENFDATTWGLELETVFAPSDAFQIIANFGYLDTEIAEGETSIDIMDRTQGNPDFVVTKPWVQLPSNCVVPVDVAESWLQGHTVVQSYWELCGGWTLTGTPVTDPNTGEDYDPANYPEINGGAGILADLSGNELPNAPHWTANIGAQYGMDILDGSWRATVRGDAYWQSQSWARVYNKDPYDKLHGWYNLNLALKLERPDDGLAIELYAKNVLDDTPITDAFLNSDDTALTTNVFTLDPRLIGLSLTKEF